MAAVTVRRIVGAGNDEAEWRASRWLGDLADKDAGVLLSGHRRLLVLSPHPDDETLACGGLMHAAARAGLEVALLAVTDGEACYPGDRAWTRARLRSHRPRELAHALAALDVDARIYRAGLPDGGVSSAFDILLAAINSLIRPGDLVLAPWERDGHPDHDAVGNAALRAVPATGARLLRYPVWAWHWLDPAAAHAPFNAFRVPLSPAAHAAKREAVACFASQLGTGVPPVADPILPPHVVARFERPFEVYLR
ncbi:PIG-L deacetylase family protein [Luteimonas kalidii]|uniref:PIG-L family deacetylase n=1 Tax=Luteimonas kalidii TaxID=3042025 RepID=A0ABT6JUG4_9GAMM|nr:PIG-L family deacetylase [Luteimonas kalidii]MDH5834334.1 PIG-L family deacetylase [Luteimonas kalidii]